VPFGPWPGSGGAGAGVSSLSINGGPARTGAIAIVSPMATNAAAQTVRLDNGNVKILASAASVGGVDPVLNNSFVLVAGENLTIEKPSTAALRDGEKITFRLTSTGVARVITWQGGVNGYQFAPGAALQGIKLADFDALAAQIDDTRFIEVGFEYSSGFSAWACVGLAGYFIAGA
jgi:hypothetical protein